MSNRYAFLANSALTQIDVLGLWGSGHHLVPVSVFNGEVSREVQEFFDSDAARIANEYWKGHNGGTLNGITHPQYTAFVRAELEEFLGPKALRTMTLQEAQAFVAYLKTMPPGTPIGDFNAGAYAAARSAATRVRAQLVSRARNAAASALRKAEQSGGKRMAAQVIGKRIPAIGIVIGLIFVQPDIESYGAGPAIANAVIDGTGIGIPKGIAESVKGYRFLDVTVGKKELDLETSTCEENPK